MENKQLSAVVARNIRCIAERKKMQITKLADFAGVSRAHLFAFLKGDKDATLSWLEKIAVALEVETEELLCRNQNSDSSR